MVHRLSFLFGMKTTHDEDQDEGDDEGCKEDLRYEFQLLLLLLLLLLPVMMMMMVIPSPIATDNLLSRENLEIFLSFYQELQTK
jgi:hypothetical protein